MAMVAGLRRVDPPLLRALRRVLPGQHGNAGFEGLVWSHADVRTGMACEVAPEASAGWLDHYRERLAPALQREHQTLRRKHHCHLRAALNHEEVLLHAAHAGADVGAVSAEEVEASEQFMARVARWSGDTGGHAAPAAWQTFASEAVRRADPRTAQRFAGVYTDLLAADLRRRGVTRPDGEDLPAWAEASRLLGRLAQGSGTVRRYWLVEDMRRQCIQLQPEPPRTLQRMLTAPIDAGHVIVGETGDPRLVVLDGAVVRLCGVDERQALALRAGSSKLLVAPVRRPHGIEGWSWTSANPAVALAVVPPDGLPKPSGPVRFEPPDEFDADRRFHLVSSTTDRYGVFRDVVFRGVTQRMRWIPPGRFLMGSPPDEPERFGNEGPQHEVTLTEGFWFADTVCTQALWRAVTGENLSSLDDDPERPVVNVRWDDVIKLFLTPLCSESDRLLLFLPTEAQWEFSCRAGTTTAFEFGGDFDPARVNAHGGRTMQVRALPPNRWGLYQMHGNVWEWCSDVPRTYTAEEKTDPVGGQAGSPRALRGGAWDFDIRCARGACRDVNHRSRRSGSIGFRFAMRDIDPVQQRPSSSGMTESVVFSEMDTMVESTMAAVDPSENDLRDEGLGSRILISVSKFFRRRL
jgi:hypothetical protein